MKRCPLLCGSNVPVKGLKLMVFEWHQLPLTWETNSPILTDSVWFMFQRDGQTQRRVGSFANYAVLRRPM